MNTLFLKADNAGVKSAADLLANGEVVALPTETVYGLAGDATLESSVHKIFAAKERPSFDPLIVHVSSEILKHPDGPLKALVDQGILDSSILTWPHKDSIEKSMSHFWPGPLTYVLPRGSRIPDAVTSRQPTVGIRMPSHPLFQAVLGQLSFPLAAPSANRFGRISPTTAEHVKTELQNRISGILDGGPCSVGVESSIISILNPLKITLLRPGKVSRNELEQFFKVPVDTQQTLGEQNQAQLAPGMLDQHYAPKKPLLLIPEPFHLAKVVHSQIKVANLSGKAAFLSQGPIPSELIAALNGEVHVLSLSASLDEAAQNLFSEMRKLDEREDIHFIVADLPAEHSAGLAAAIADRLNRASINKPLKK